MMRVAKVRQQVTAMYTGSTNELLTRVKHIGCGVDSRTARSAVVTREERSPPPRYPRAAASR
jgi:hypothetical protein